MKAVIASVIGSASPRSAVRVARSVLGTNPSYADFYDPQMLWEVEVKLSPDGLSETFYPGFYAKINRATAYNPYGIDGYYVYASYGGMSVGEIESLAGGKYISHETGMNNRGMTTTVAKRLSPDPFAQWDEADTSATIYIDCASGLPEDPTEPFSNTKIIAPFRGDADYDLALIQPLVLTAASGVTLTPARLTEVAEFTGLLVDATIAAPAAAINGRRMVIRLRASGADRALTWDAYYRGIGVALPETAPNGKWVYVTGYFNTIDAKFDVVDVKVQT
jgi:hypothetical protein